MSIWAKIVELNPLLHYLDLVRTASRLTPRAAALGGGNRADRDRLGGGGFRDAAVPRPRGVLGVSGRRQT
jgi:hypothetical protein